MLISQICNLVKILESQHFVFAKTMPKNPHFYTVKKNWNSKTHFVQCVKLIRFRGVREKFKGSFYTVFYCNGFKYWTMFASDEATTIINRKPVSYSNEYDPISDKYDSFFNGLEFIQEEKDLFDILNIEPNKSVLDIGCGTGLLKKYVNVKEYLGIDPSKGMLDQFNLAYPNAKTLNVPFQDFYPTKKYDYVLSLFGSPSYFDPKILLERISECLKDDGKVFLMYFRNSYVPVTHELMSKPMKYYHFRGKETILLDKYNLVTHEDIFR